MRQVPKPVSPARGDPGQPRRSDLRPTTELTSPPRTGSRRVPPPTGRRTPLEVPGHSGMRHRPRCIPITLRPRFRACRCPGRPGPLRAATLDAPPGRCPDHRRDHLSCRNGGDREAPGRPASRTTDLGPTAVPALAGRAGPVRRGTCPLRRTSTPATFTTPVISTTPVTCTTPVSSPRRVPTTRRPRTGIRGPADRRRGKPGRADQAGPTGLAERADPRRSAADPDAPTRSQGPPGRPLPSALYGQAHPPDPTGTQDLADRPHPTASPRQAHPPGQTGSQDLPDPGAPTRSQDLADPPDLTASQDQVDPQDPTASQDPPDPTARRDPKGLPRRAGPRAPAG